MGSAASSHQSDQPSAVMFDVGMTLILVDGDVVARQVERTVGVRLAADLARDALALAVDARHDRLPYNSTGDERVAIRWGSLLGLDKEEAVAAFAAVTSHPSLYGPVADGAAQMLGELRRADVSTVAVANADGQLERELSEAGLLDLFDFIIDSQVVGIEKPDPRVFHHACELAGVGPSDAAFIGDDFINDYLGSQAAGFRTSLLFDPSGVRSGLPSIPTIGHLSEIPVRLGLRRDSDLGR